MSVESARLALRKATIDAVAIGQMTPPWYGAADRLILEVQADMPCYEWSDCEARKRFADQPGTLEYYTDVCPSCVARAELKAAT